MTLTELAALDAHNLTPSQAEAVTRMAAEVMGYDLVSVKRRPELYIPVPCEDEDILDLHRPYRPLTSYDDAIPLWQKVRKKFTENFIDRLCAGGFIFDRRKHHVVEQLWGEWHSSEGYAYDFDTTPSEITISALRGWKMMEEK